MSRSSRPAHALHLQAEHHVLQRRQPRQQLGELKHHAAIVAAAPHLATVHRDLARRRGFEPHGDPQRRGLAAARGADERDDLAVLHGEVDAAERLHGLQRAVDAQREPFRYVVQGHLTHAASYREPESSPIRLGRPRALPASVHPSSQECFREGDGLPGQGFIRPGNDDAKACHSSSPRQPPGVIFRCAPALPCGYRDKSAC